MNIINGKIYGGKSISISGNKIIIDGKDVTPNSKEITIVINADLDSLEVDVCEYITIHGNCNTVESTNGSIKVSKDIKGDVRTTNGNVIAGVIHGNTRTTNGSIISK